MIFRGLCRILAMEVALMCSAWSLRPVASDPPVMCGLIRCDGDLSVKIIILIYPELGGTSAGGHRASEFYLTLFISRYNKTFRWKSLTRTFWHDVSQRKKTQTKMKQISKISAYKRLGFLSFSCVMKKCVK